MILERDLDAFLRGKEERIAVPTVTALRDYFEKERQEVLALHGDDADKATRLLINRLLHTPSEELRNIAADKSKKEFETVGGLLAKLFLKEK